MATVKEYIIFQKSKVTSQDRYLQNDHKGFVIWVTGLPGSGKSTLMVELEKVLYTTAIHSYLLDGDNLRHGLNKDLGFSPQERHENVRRVGEVAKLFVDAGLIALVSLVSPYRADRNMIRGLFPKGDFIEIYLKCSIQECERRDPKGLYQKAREGAIHNFTGVSAPYEVPTEPELIVDTEYQTIEESVEQIIRFLKENDFI